MWKTTKFFIALIIVAALFTSTAGIALADDGQNNGGPKGFWDVLAQAFNTTAENAKNLFMQARGNKPPPPQSENGTPERPPASDNMTPRQPPTGEYREEITAAQIDALLADGKLTSEQAAEYKAWLANRPDGPFVDKNRMDNLLEAGTITQEQYDAWKARHETKPDIELPGPNGQGNGNNKPNGQDNGNNKPNGQGNGNTGPQGNKPPPPVSDNMTPNQPPTGENHRPPPPPGGPGGNRR